MMIESLLLLIVAGLIQDGMSAKYTGCLGSTGECCVENGVSLYPYDSLELTASADTATPWCPRVILAEWDGRGNGACEDCTLTVKFSNYRLSPALMSPQVILLEAKYSNDMSSQVPLSILASYNSTRYLPQEITSTGNLLKIAFGDGGEYSTSSLSDIKITVRPNAPQDDSQVAITIGLISGASFILAILVSFVSHRLRQRRIRRLQASVAGRLATVVVAAALERQMNRRAQRVPDSPDPSDSIAPPSYLEAAPPPPSYSEAMEQTPDSSDNAADIELIDTAAPDDGSDTARLVV